MLRLTTVGRRTGRQREAILGFIQDGASFVTPAMNGWLDPDPAWWLNLQANPDARVALADGTSRDVTARAATGQERERLWNSFLALHSAAFTNENAALRSRDTALVILEPRREACPPAC
jgi:deazaflavin-dependent oxidoreductase (nitroreductase family)